MWPKNQGNLEGSKRDTKKREDKSKTTVGKKVKGRRKAGGLKE